jgi:hypothetical protein
MPGAGNFVIISIFGHKIGGISKGGFHLHPISKTKNQGNSSIGR